MSNNRFNVGDLNPNISARTGQTIDPQRFSVLHIQQKLVEQYTQPTGFLGITGPLKGVVLRQEGKTSKNDLIEGFHGLSDLEQDPRVKIRVRIPELHPFPDPDNYGDEGLDGIISLYPIFVAVSSDLDMPGVGEIVYVDYGDRENLELPRYYGKVFNKAVGGGSSENINTTKEGGISSIFDGVSDVLNDLKNHILPPTNENPNPTPTTTNQEPEEFNEFPLYNVKNLSQGDYGGLIGNSKIKTISSKGCLLTSITMAYNTFYNEKMNPVQANRLIKKNNGFAGADIIQPTAASVLGMKTTGKIVQGTVSDMRAITDETLLNGGLIIFHVDKNDNRSGDHFVLVHGKVNDNYVVADPSTGEDFLMDSNTLKTEFKNDKGKVERHYKVISAIPYYKK